MSMDIDLCALAKLLRDGTSVPDAVWSAYESSAGLAWNDCSDSLVLTHLAVRGGAWDGVGAAFGAYSREVEQRLRSQLAGDADVQASLVAIHYGLDLLRRALAAHDVATALQLAASLPEDEELESMDRHIAALLHQFMPSPPDAASLRAPRAAMDPDELARVPEAWPTATKALEGRYGEPESPVTSLPEMIDDARYGLNPAVDDALARFESWKGAGKDGLAAAWEVCDDGEAMREVLEAVGRLDDELRSRCQGLELEGHFSDPERYEHLHGLACATLLRFAGIAAPTIDELREALARIIADADADE